MPGAPTDDSQLFHSDVLPTLREAAVDLRYLYGRGYAWTASTKLVGDRYRLVKRQRELLERAVCSNSRAALVSSLALSSVRGESLFVDGYNVLITVESALAGRLVVACDDGLYRDISGMHGTFRTSEVTQEALRLISHTLREHEPEASYWFLDKKMARSGELAASFRAFSQGAEVVDAPDFTILETIRGDDTAVAVSSDSRLLGQDGRHFDLAATVIQAHIPSAWVVSLHP